MTNRQGEDLFFHKFFTEQISIGYLYHVPQGLPGPRDTAGTSQTGNNRGADGKGKTHGHGKEHAPWDLSAWKKSWASALTLHRIRSVTWSIILNSPQSS